MEVMEHTRDTPRPPVVKLVDSAALSLSIAIDVVEKPPLMTMDEMEELKISIERMGRLLMILTGEAIV